MLFYVHNYSMSRWHIGEGILHHIKLIVALSASVFLVGCGGGSSDPAPTPAKSLDPPKKTYYTPQAPQIGDTYLYKNQVLVPKGTPTPSATQYSVQVGAVSATGDYYTNTYSSDTHMLISTDLYNTKRDLLTTRGCRYTPVRNDLPLPWYVGQVATQNLQQICGEGAAAGGPAVSTHSKVLGYESVSVAAGTFNTIKTSVDTETTFTDPDFTDFPSVIPATTSTLSSTSTNTETCWIDVQSGFPVKCTNTYTLHLPKVLSSSVTGQVLAALLGDGLPQITQSELTSIKHAADAPFSLTASINGVAISGLYLTPSEQQSISVVGDKTLTVNATQALNWTIKGSKSTGSPIAFSGSQSVVVDGYSVNLSVVDGTITAKVLGTSLPALSGFTLTGTSPANPTQSISISVSLDANAIVPYAPSPISNCFGGLKFC